MEMEADPQNRENTGRNEDGTFKAGSSGNPGGRPKNTMKDYVARKFNNMTDEEKEQWLIEHKISGIDVWRMGEGNPESKTDLTTGGEKLPPQIIVYGETDPLREQLNGENTP